MLEKGAVRPAKNVRPDRYARMRTSLRFHNRVTAMIKTISYLRAGIMLAMSALSLTTALAASAVPDTLAQRALACTACHDREHRATSEAWFPRIAGKPAGYLYNQLINFREGRRRYPMMTYMVDHLSDAYLLELAQYFSALNLPYPPVSSPVLPAVRLARGRMLVEKGDATLDLPACASCHGATLTGLVPAVPGLVGLPREYLVAQLGAWKTALRRAAAPDCMAEIAKRLTPDDVSAVTDWLSTRPIPAKPAPATRLPSRPVLACGSMSH